MRIDKRKIKYEFGFIIQNKLVRDGFKLDVNNISILINRWMSSGLEQQVQVYRKAYKELELSFRNNLNVIKQLQEENNQLQEHLAEMEQKYMIRLQREITKREQTHKEEMMNQEMQFGRQLQLVKKQYEDFISALNQTSEKKTQETLKTVTKRHKSQIEQMRLSFNKQLQNIETEKRKYVQKNKALQQSLSSTQTKLNTINLTVISLQSENQQLRKQKKQTQTLYAGYQQELQSLKNSSNSWEDVLKQRIKQLQLQKSKLEEEMTEWRFMQKEKTKKLTLQHSKKMSQVQESYTIKMNEILRESREIKFRFEKIKEENLQLRGESDRCRRDLAQSVKELQQLKLKTISAQDSLLVIKEKQYELKSLQEEVRRLKAEIQSIQLERNQLKEQNQRVNFERQAAQKATERLKVQLLNKIKQNQQIKKLSHQLKYQNQLNQFNSNNNNNNNNKHKQKKTQQTKPNKDITNKPQPVEYSRCFTQDMGPVDENFFNPNSSYRPTKRQQSYIGSYDQIQQDDQSHQIEQKQSKESMSQLMRRIGELQVENGEYKGVIKTMKEEMERMTIMIDDKLGLKDRQIRLGKEENMMLRERLNGKEEQLMAMRQTIQQIRQQLQRKKEQSSGLKELQLVKQQNESLSMENKKLSTKIEELKEEIECLIKERKTLQEIADDLRVEVDYLKGQIDQIMDRQQHARSYSLTEGKYHKGVSGSSQYTHQMGQSSYNQTHLNHNYQPMNNHHDVKSINLKKPLSQKPSYSNPHQNHLIHSKPIQHIPKSKSKSKSPQQQRQTSTKPIKRKLHELIKHKNQLQSQKATIMGKKAVLQRRPDEERTQHVGTRSQREIYQRLQRVSKSRSKQKPVSKLKDYEIPLKPQRETISGKQKTRNVLPQKVQQSQMDSKQQQLNSQQISPSYYQQSEQQPSHAQYSNRVEMMKKMREEMRNDSLGEFDHLENVSLTYWEQQV